MANPEDDVPEPDDDDPADAPSADPAEDDDQPHEVPTFDAVRFLAGVDLTGMAAIRNAIGNIDFTGIEAIRRATAGIDVTGIEAIRAATQSVNFTGLEALRLGIGNIDFTGIEAARRAAAGVDFAGLLRGIDFTQLFTGLDITNLNAFYPPNWPSGVDLDRVTAVINGDGIPIVWVPRESIVEEVLAAPDRAARIDILLSHSADVAVDCREVLDEITEPTLAGQLPLANRALDAFAEGHLEAAQALATVVTETAVAGALSGKYTEVKKVVLFDPDEVPWTRLRLAAALGPIYRFYTTWFRRSGTPAPVELSRHVTVHEADASHYTSGNALVAVLLVTSVLRAIQELQGGARRDGGGPEEEAA